VNFFTIAVIATLYASNGPAGPVVAPLDQSSDVIVVGNVNPGARIDAYANAIWIGAATAIGPTVGIKPVRALQPGDEIVAVERTGSYTAYGGEPTAVSHDYPTYHYDSMRTGWNQSETELTQANVGSSNFGKIFATAVDGNVEAQPLELTGVDVPGKGTHDVVYAATEDDSLYALDAASGNVLWKRTYVDSAHGFSPLSDSDVGGCPFISPKIGITGTPVIDRAGGYDVFRYGREADARRHNVPPVLACS
jgi:outer membrane protein assembly factor BamB